MRIPGIPYIQGKNSYSDRDSLKYGVAIHCTANTASARAEASYATRRTDGVSAHLFADDREVIQSLDTKARAGHAGSAEGNDHAIAVEITGLVSWSRATWLESVAWDKLGRVLAHIIQKDPHFAGKGFQVRRASVDEMRRNPKVQALYGHDDMRRAWGGTTHTDPGPNFPWDRLFQAINDALEDDDMKPTDNLPVKDWLKTAYPHDRDLHDGITVQTALVSGYGFARLAADRAAALEREVAALRKEVAALRGAGATPELDYDRLAEALLRRIARG